MTIHRPWQSPSIIRHSQRLAVSFEHWTGQPLALASGADELANCLFCAPFALLSHGMEADPVLNYGNQTALDLWQISWERLTQMPSRFTAEPTERQERATQLAQAATAGCIKNYAGVRITQGGERFLIKGAVIWDVLDESGLRCGQAAKFSQWTWLREDS